MLLAVRLRSVKSQSAFAEFEARQLWIMTGGDAMKDTNNLASGGYCRKLELSNREHNRALSGRSTLLL